MVNHKVMVATLEFSNKFNLIIVWHSNLGLRSDSSQHHPLKGVHLDHISTINSVYCKEGVNYYVLIIGYFYSSSFDHSI